MVDLIPMPGKEKVGKLTDATKEAKIKKMIEQARRDVKKDPSKENKNRLKMLEDQHLLDGGKETYTVPKDLKLPGSKRRK